MEVIVDKLKRCIDVLTLSKPVQRFTLTSAPEKCVYFCVYFGDARQRLTAVAHSLAVAAVPWKPNPPAAMNILFLTLADGRLDDVLRGKPAVWKMGSMLRPELYQHLRRVDLKHQLPEYAYQLPRLFSQVMVNPVTWKYHRTINSTPHDGDASDKPGRLPSDLQTLKNLCSRLEWDYETCVRQGVSVEDIDKYITHINTLQRMDEDLLMRQQHVKKKKALHI